MEVEGDITVILYNIKLQHFLILPEATTPTYETTRPYPTSQPHVTSQPLETSYHSTTTLPSGTTPPFVITSPQAITPTYGTPHPEDNTKPSYQTVHADDTGNRNGTTHCRKATTIHYMNTPPSGGSHLDVITGSYETGKPEGTSYMYQSDGNSSIGPTVNTLTRQLPETTPMSDISQPNQVIHTPEVTQPEEMSYPQQPIQTITNGHSEVTKQAYTESHSEQTIIPHVISQPNGTEHPYATNQHLKTGQPFDINSPEQTIHATNRPHATIRYNKPTTLLGHHSQDTGSNGISSYDETTQIFRE